LVVSTQTDIVQFLFHNVGYKKIKAYSQAKTFPAIKQASRSSDARILTIPATAKASAIENTRKDSLSIKFL